MGGAGALLLLLPLHCGAASGAAICEKTLLGKPCDAWGENEVSPGACTRLVRRWSGASDGHRYRN